jgi:hypothetical protein
VCLILAVTACGETTEVGTIAGAYAATKFDVTPDGQSTQNALAEGAVLTIEIAADNSTTGTLSVPASLTGGAPLVASMVGTATLEGDSVRFDQAANTFVRQDYWKRNGSTLSMSHHVDGVTLAVTLAR